MLVLAASALLVYGETFNQEFLHWDDYAYVVDNTNIHHFNLQNLKWAFFDHYFYNWHPITWLVYMIEYRLWGENASLFKLVNIGIHLINSCLIVLLANKILNILYPALLSTSDEEDKRRWIACIFAGTLFAIHPLHVESVVWISELKDLLSGMFFFIALIAYINYRQSEHDTRWRNLLGLAFLCALMSKSMAVTLPAILLAMDIFLFKRLARTNLLPDLLVLIREKLLYFIVSICAIALTFISQNSEALASTSLVTRLVNASESVSLYLGHFLIPVNLSPFYPFSSLSMEPGLHSLIPVVILATVIIGLFMVDRFAFKGPIFALIFFLIAILPVIGLIRVGDQAAADRYTYIPMSMFFIASGCGFYRFLDVFSRSRIISRLGLGSALVVLGGYAGQTIAYVPVWQTDEKLWTHVNTLYPMQVASAYLNLGNVEFGKGNSKEALQFYEIALSIDNGNVNALGNRAAVNERLGFHAYAASLYQDLADLHSDSRPALNISALGMRRLGKLELSAKYYQLALLLAPTSNPQLYESALADHMIGNNDSAHEKVAILLQLNDAHREGRFLNVALLFTLGFPKEATLELDMLRVEYPSDPKIYQIDLQLQNQLAQ